MHTETILEHKSFFIMLLTNFMEISTSVACLAHHFYPGNQIGHQNTSYQIWFGNRYGLEKKQIGGMGPL